MFEGRFVAVDSLKNGPRLFDLFISGLAGPLARRRDWLILAIFLLQAGR
jgi:hypothetical protein